MSAILKSLNAHKFPIFQSSETKLVSNPIVYRAPYYKTYFSFGLQSPLIVVLRAIVS